MLFCGVTQVGSYPRSRSFREKTCKNIIYFFIMPPSGPEHQQQSSSSPPNSNPILSAYIGFVQSTPLVTRYVITLACCTYVSSWFVDPTFALTNIPMFTVERFELYRILTSSLLCPTLLNLIFAYLSFVESGKRLEYAMGSGAFAYLLFLLAVLTNLLYLLGSFILFGLTSNHLYLMGSCGSIWIWILSLLASECSRAPCGSTRRLFVVNVPTLYFPLAILLLFSLLSGSISTPFCLAVAAGYAYGYGHLSRFQVTPERITKWETNQGCLSNFAKRDGWIYRSDAQGIGAWSNNTSSAQQQVPSFEILIFCFLFFSHLFVFPFFSIT